MPLTKIADLDQEELIVGSYNHRAQDLGVIYSNYIARSEGTRHEYKVEIAEAKTRLPGIHASEISKCMRALVYSIAGTERLIDNRRQDINMLMRFKIGHAVHAMIQSDWHRIANESEGLMWFEDEIHISPDLGGLAAQWNIRSSCDGVITLLNTKTGEPEVRIGIEIKTQSDKQFSKLSAPLKEHVEQATTYMATLDLPLMWLIYYNKSNSNITPSRYPYLFRFDKQLWEDDLEMRFAWAMHMAETGQIPAGTEGMYCRWCQFSHVCKPSMMKPKTSNARQPYHGMSRRTR